LKAVTFADEDLIKEKIGKVYTVNENNYTGWGFPYMAKFKVNLIVKL
jgi:hypothetical protein